MFGHTIRSSGVGTALGIGASTRGDLCMHCRPSSGESYICFYQQHDIRYAENFNAWLYSSHATEQGAHATPKTS
jgi:hypothetical protein